MKSRLILAALASFSLSVCFAIPQNFCKSSVTGNWEGFFVLKNKSDCEKLKGCYHKVSANITQLNNDILQIDIKPSAGHGGIVHGTCQDSVIKIVELPNSSTRVECLGKACAVRHHSDELYAYLAHK